VQRFFGQPEPASSRQSRIKVRSAVKLPTGYYIVYGGQYEAQSEAVDQIMLLGSAAIVGIFILLFLAFGSLRQAFLVMANLPLALIGGLRARPYCHEGRDFRCVARRIHYVSALQSQYRRISAPWRRE